MTPGAPSRAFEGDDRDTGAHRSRGAHRSGSAGHAGERAGIGRLVIGIATTGRAPILTPTLRAIAGQSRLPDLALISTADHCDVDAAALAGLPFETRVLTGPRGSSPQRNAILDALAAEDAVLFLDDDFLLAPDYLSRLEALLVEAPDIALVTGRVLADGVTGPGLSLAEGERVLARAPARPGAVRPAYSGYGCNMAVRMAPVRAHGLRFDEDLPLYAWLEDVDFSRQLAAHGRLVRADALRGVHLGTKMARSPGRRLGYSQIANPIHLTRKGTMTARHALKLMARNVASNVWYTPRPRPWTDSRGRLSGNVLAVRDWATGRLHPGRVRDL